VRFFRPQRRDGRARSRTLPVNIHWAWPLGFALVLLLTSCTTGGGNAPSLLDPRGPAASRVAGLIWLLFAIAGAICLLVLLALLWALFRRHGQGENAARPFNENRVIVIFGVTIPALILFVVYGFSLATTAYLAAPPSNPRLTINVVAHQWWWEVQYPEQQFATANEIHIPVGQSIQVKVTSDDVIHDFWVPQLNDKIDMFPGRTNTTWLQASEPGTYRGVCAEYCGAEHALMNFVVVAESPAQFETWLTAQSQPALQPAAQGGDILRGYQTFIGSSCSYCHAVKGTDAAGKYGPDLTHFAGRETIAAGTLPNTRGNLAGWITNTQGIKPGNRMPAFPLDARSLQDLLAYLQSLT